MALPPAKGSWELKTLQKKLKNSLQTFQGKVEDIFQKIEPKSQDTEKMRTLEDQLKRLNV